MVSGAGTERRIEYAIELPPSDVGRQPARLATAERDDSGPIAPPERGLHDLHGSAHRSFGGLGRWPRGLRIGVDEHDDVGGLLAESVSHVQAAATGAHRPVHRAQRVARRVGPNVGVLDARADSPTDVRADTVGQLGAWDGGRSRGGDWKHVQLDGVERRGSGEQATTRVGRHVGPNGVTAPSFRSAGDREAV